MALLVYTEPNQAGIMLHLCLFLDTELQLRNVYKKKNPDFSEAFHLIISNVVMNVSNRALTVSKVQKRFQMCEKMHEKAVSNELQQRQSWEISNWTFRVLSCLECTITYALEIKPTCYFQNIG